MKLRSYMILMEPDPADKTGGKAKEGEAPPPATDPVKALRKQHGSDEAVVRAVLAERDAVAAKLAETQARLPRDGHRVIDPDTAKALDEYLGLGHKPGDLAKALADRDDYKSRLDKRDRQDHLARVAGLHGFKAPVLTTLAERDGLEIVIGEEKDPKDPAKTVEIARVKGKDEKGNETLTPLDSYASKHWGDFLQALKPDAPRLAPLGSPPASNGPPRPPVVKSGERAYPNFVR